MIIYIECESCETKAIELDDEIARQLVDTAETFGVDPGALLELGLDEILLAYRKRRLLRAVGPRAAANMRVLARILGQMKVGRRLGFGGRLVAGKPFRNDFRRPREKVKARGLPGKSGL